MGSAAMTEKTCLFCKREFDEKDRCYAVLEGSIRLDCDDVLFYENEDEPPDILVCKECYPKWADMGIYGQRNINRLGRALAVLEGAISGTVSGLKDTGQLPDTAENLENALAQARRYKEGEA
ncbi:MAG: hypothetical protein KAJ07_00350 [Planctomycetes bacterium]|nr:hypothetical protein [Planctomycetota bacterium]